VRRVSGHQGIRDTSVWRSGGGGVRCCNTTLLRLLQPGAGSPPLRPSTEFILSNGEGLRTGDESR
jgi:hypothetical protein